MDVFTKFVRHLLLLVVLLVNVPIFQAIIWSPASNVLLAGSKRHITYIDSVSAGIQNAVKECQFQFKWDKWNCPEVSVFTNTQANVRCVHSSHRVCGVMYSLTKNCSQGAFDDCGCDKRRNGNSGGEGWTWGGCSDNVRFGERMASDIMDDAESSQGAISVMTLHNNEAGRKAVKQTLQRTCKCHGVSGSCSLQTCWNHVANFRVIGDEIKRKYFQAVRVDFVRGKLIDGNSAEDRFPQAVVSASHNRRDLVFLDQSPDYCRANLTIGVTGTAGRECMVREDVTEVSSSSSLTKDSTSPSSFRWVKQSCSRLCRSCGMVIRKTQVIITSSCNCNFVWCCQVKCDTCRRTVTRRTCQPVG
ncbi:Wnt8 protein [Strongylocentrotus purpuratus]|uniref:Protein Wnt n=1 Tax=Strongylocentrotus purpuratus TaxID=7668 RepID=Q6RFL8_STRPU|nr:Wnt8 protein [Strongylocentrotus purpuratus]AAR97610.1 Wnt8 [Strongylocentrotus purpuratus]|eukprot:NP_999832.1 Wnt8 protein [Strongylocentrotus purpuratus]